MVTICNLTFPAIGVIMNSQRTEERKKMTVEDLIIKLLEFPMNAEVVKTYSVSDDDGEEWTMEDEPVPYLFQGKVEL